MKVLKKILSIVILMQLIATPVHIIARGGFGSGFGLGLLGGALLTSAAYNAYPSYGYYPTQPYPHVYGPQPQYTAYGHGAYAPYY